MSAAVSALVAGLGCGDGRSRSSPQPILKGVDVSVARIFLDKSACHGCGICAEVAPHTFLISARDGLAFIRQGRNIVGSGVLDDVVVAVDECPCDAIGIYGVDDGGTVSAPEGINDFGD